MAGNLDIEPTMQTEQAFVAVARGCIERYRRHLPELRQNWDPEALHQARVGLRQLIAAFALFKPMIEDAPFRMLRVRVKSAARILGEARNLDVVLEASHRPELPALRSTVSVLRSRTYAGVMQRLESGGNRHLAEDLLDWVENGPWRKLHKDLRREKLSRFAGRRLDRVWRKFRKRSRHLAELAPAPRHKVRIAAKKLRYGLEFMAPVAREFKARRRRDALIETLKRLQDALGALNDLRTEKSLARDFIRQGNGIAYDTGRLIGAEEVRTAPLLRQAARSARKLRKRKPFW